MAEAVLITGGQIRQRVEQEGPVALRDLAALLHPGSEEFPAPTIALAGGQPVLRENDGWSLPISPNGIVIFIELPMGGGGGSNPFTAILGVVAAALLIWNPGGQLALAAGLSQVVAGETVLTATGLFVSSIVNGAILMGASALVGALGGFSKVPSGLSGAYNAATASPTYNINSSGNQARLYQPEPEGFGRMKIIPDYIATPWVQYIENEQYGYFVYALGRGSYDVESMSFGDTVFWRASGGVDSAYDNVQVEFVPAGSPVTLFPDNVISSTEVSGQELYGPNEAEYKGPLGPYVTNPPGTQTNQIQLDIVLPQGIGRYDDNANLQEYSIDIKAEYRVIDDLGQAQSEWALLRNENFKGATLTPQRRTLLCDVAPGRYEVQITRTSNSPVDGRTMDTVQWSAMRAMLPGSLSYGVSAVAVKIRATNTLSNNASTKLSIICTRKLPLYDRLTRTWSEETPTRSWAAAVSAVCKESWGGGLSDGEIDLDRLWAIDERMQARGWYFDAYIDGTYTIWQLITEMCQVMISVPRLEGSILSFVEDCSGRPVRYMLTPRNIRRASFKLTWNTWSSSTPDDVVMNYKDAAYGFQQRDVKAVLPESESREETSLEMLGITGREHAFRVAVGYAARNRWRRVGVECQVEGLGRLMNRGDVVTVSHPRLRNTSSGKVEAWSEDTLTITLRKDTGDIPSDVDLYLALSRPDGSPWGPCKLSSCTGHNNRYRAILDAEDYASLLLQGSEAPWSWMTFGEESLPTLWTLQSSRHFIRRMLVQSVVPADLWTYTLNLVNDDDRVYSYDDLPVPAWEGRGQLPTVDSLAAPKNLTVAIGGTSQAPILNASWLTVSGAEAYEVEVSTDAEAWLRVGRVNINRMSVSVSRGPVWLRVAAVREDMRSPWAIWSGDTRVSVPAATSPQVSFEGATFKVSWPAVSGAAQYGINIVPDLTVVSTVRITDALEYALTPTIAADIGGPWRKVTAQVWAENASGMGPIASATAEAPAPAVVTDASIDIGSDSITLNSVTGPGDVTGYVLLQGATPDFDASSITSMQTISSLPFTLSGLTPETTYYFRIAGKDAWFDDVPTSYASLNFSAVLPITTAAAGG